MWFSLFISLLLVVLVFVGVDAWVHFNTWQSRIKIGRITNDLLWTQALKNRAVRWLTHTPVAKLTDNSRLLLWDMLQGNYKRSTIQIWQKAALYIGLTDLSEATNDSKLRSIITQSISGMFRADGTWKIKPQEIDWVMMSHAVIRLHWKQLPQKYEPAFDETYALILSLQGADGLIAYKKHMPEYRYVDTLGFICPFLTHYGLKFNHPEAVALAYQQLEEFHQYGMMPQEFLPCHTYQTHSKLPVGLFGWGRGLAWYGYGLMDMYLALPHDHSYKTLLAVKIEQFLASVLKFQNPDGSWNWLLFDSSSRSDSSTTAVVGWMLSALPESISSNETETALTRAKTYLQSVTQRNGAIDFSQGDTKAIGVHAQTFELLPFTQGFALRMMAHHHYNASL